MKNFIDYIIDKQQSCLEALKKLDSEKSNQTLFVLDESKRLIGTVTDGDIRRGLIKGLNINTPIIEFCYPNFHFIDGDINVAEIRKLKKAGIKVLPKLNKERQIERVYDLSVLQSILPLHVVIMAGGRGERLRPLTDHTPKPMLTLGNKPIIEHNIDRLISFGIETITISVRYLSEQILAHFGDGSSKGISINYIEEDAPLGTIGCLSLIESFKQDDILVLNSDVFTSIDFEDFYLDYLNSKADMAVASTSYSVDIPYAIMELNENCITSFKEKPKNTYYANAGIYIFNKKSVKHIKKNTFCNATDLMNAIITANGKIIHSPIAGYWIDIGAHDDYNKAKEIMRHL
jgi:dTDP-glucose pyrophosphorylase